MTVEQLASDYKQLMAVTNYMASAMQSIDIFQKYNEESTLANRRIWSNYNCWLYQGEAIANVNYAQIELAVEKFKKLMETINHNQELKMLLQGKDMSIINAPQK
jgi:hypothetical protein